MKSKTIALLATTSMVPGAFLALSHDDTARPQPEPAQPKPAASADHQGDLAVPLPLFGEPHTQNNFPDVDRASVRPPSPHHSASAEPALVRLALTAEPNEPQLPPAPEFNGPSAQITEALATATPDHARPDLLAASHVDPVMFEPDIVAPVFSGQPLPITELLATAPEQSHTAALEDYARIAPEQLEPEIVQPIFVGRPDAAERLLATSSLSPPVPDLATVASIDRASLEPQIVAPTFADPPIQSVTLLAATAPKTSQPDFKFSLPELSPAEGVAASETEVALPPLPPRGPLTLVAVNSQPLAADVLTFDVASPIASAFEPSAEPVYAPPAAENAVLIERPRITMTPAVQRGEPRRFVQAGAPAPRATLPVDRALAAVQPQSTSANTIVVEPAPITAADLPSPKFGPPVPELIPASLSLSSDDDSAPKATPGKVSTLGQAVSYSYETNPLLLAQRASTRSADYGLPAARAAYGPSVSARASVIFNRDRIEYLPGTFTPAQGWTDTASLILSQPLLTFGRNRAGEASATARIEFERASLKLRQNEVMLGVVSAYVGVIREAGAVTIARENVALLEKEFTDSSERFRVREITSSDVQQVETRLNLGRTTLLNSQARLGEAQAEFLRLVGMPPGELAPPEALTIPVTSLSEAYATSDVENPLIHAAQAREKISRAAMQAARSEKLPRVDFQGTANYGTLNEYSSSLRTTRLQGQVTLSVPLFNTGGRTAEAQQAEEANAADWRLMEAASRDSRAQIATAWNNVLAARRSLDFYRDATQSAQRSYEGALLQERAGMRTTLDVLDLARDLLNVRNAYNSALADEYVARASLLSAMGRLDPATFAPEMKLYDPQVHYRKVRGNNDMPLLTGALSALDGVVTTNLSRERPNQDAAALTGTDETVTGQ